MTEVSTVESAKLLDPLIELSRRYGADPDMVLAGGGNTSAKTPAVLWVKASGVALGSIDRDGFVPLDRRKLLALTEVDLPAAPEQANELQNRHLAEALLVADDPRRPSVECVLHAVFPQTFVVHTHPVLGNMVACCVDGQRIAAELMGDRLLWLEYVDPGLPLSQAMSRRVSQYQRRHGRPPALVLVQNHGLFVAADGPADIDALTEAFLGKVSQRLSEVAEWRGAPPFGEVRSVAEDDAAAMVESLGSALKAALSEASGAAVHLCFDDSEAVRQLAGGSRGREVAERGPLMPDQSVYAGSFAMWLQPPGADPAAAADAVADVLGAYRDRHGTWPRIVLVEGLGMFAAGHSAAESRTAGAVYEQAIRVMGGAERLGGVRALTEPHRRFIEDWEAEAYRKAQAQKAGQSEGGPPSYRPRREWPL